MKNILTNPKKMAAAASVGVGGVLLGSGAAGATPSTAGQLVADGGGDLSAEMLLVIPAGLTVGVLVFGAVKGWRTFKRLI